MGNESIEEYCVICGQIIKVGGLKVVCKECCTQNPPDACEIDQTARMKKEAKQFVEQSVGVAEKKKEELNLEKFSKKLLALKKEYKEKLEIRINVKKIKK